MKHLLKTYTVLLTRFLLRAGHILPVKKRRVLFSAYEGLQYGCNPKYIFEALKERYPETECIWVLNDPEKLPAKYQGMVRTVKFLTIPHLKALLTSHVIVSNLGIEPILPKRKKQFFINTWHGGGAYKQVSAELDMFSVSQKRYVRTMRDLRAGMTDMFLSSCRRFSEVSSKDFAVPSDRFIKSGMPRNDRFFNRNEKDRDELRKQICDRYGLDSGNLLVLYAPTFRGNHRDQENIDNKVCCPEVATPFRKRFGRPVSFLFRSHISKNSPVQKKRTDCTVVDFTGYPDMQELLEIADILITDYSSSIWDFSLTAKPGFLYTPDLRDYLESRGFYTPISDWPYPYAEDIEGFIKLIENYSEENNKERIVRHQELLGNYEKGTATTQVVETINEIITQ